MGQREARSASRGEVCDILKSPPHRIKGRAHYISKGGDLFKNHHTRERVKYAGI